MIFGYLILLSALTLSGVAAYYSVTGLVAIFSALPIPIIIMGATLEVGKIVATVWLHNNWKRAGTLFKLYLVPAVVVLMFLTSVGIFGLLSKAHSDQGLVTGDAMSKIAIYDEKITAERDNIAAAKKALEQMNMQVDQMMGRTDSDKGAERAVTIRKQQARERASLQADITRSQKNIQALQQERAPLAAEFRKVEAEVGPIKYIAAFIYGDDPDQNVLEKAVRWVIILIVIVFDPLALCLILAANKQLEWARHGTGGWIHDEEPIVPPVTEAVITPPRAPEPPEVTEEEEAAFAAMHTEANRYFANTEVKTDQVKHDELDIPVLENEEMWSQRVIDEANEKIAEVEKPELEIFFENEPEPELLTQEHKQFIESAANIIVELTDDLEDKKLAMHNLQQDYNLLEEQNRASMERSFVLSADITQLQKVITELEAARNVERERANNLTERLADTIPINDFEAPVLTPVADNAVELRTAPDSSFGTEFPAAANKGDLFLRTDYLPTKLFKYNGATWFELDKANTDSYAYNDQYIEYLIEKLRSGEYDTDDITDTEHEQIAQYLQERNENS
jgi:cytochrome c oxidase subunit IV